MKRQVERSSHLALLIDGTALFLALKYLGEASLNYIALLELIREECEACDWPPKPAYFFTSADPLNTGQSKFHSFLEDRAGIQVVECAPKDSNTINQLLQPGDATNWTRFDALISYSIGALVGSRGAGQIVVVSDSWPLSSPIMDAAEKEGVSVKLAFFGRAVDARYHRLVRDNSVEFLDLDDHTDKLFQRGHLPNARRTGSGLKDLFS